MKTKYYVLSALFGLSLASVTANASLIEVTPTTSPLKLDNNSITVTFSGAAEKIFFSSDSHNDVGSQGASNIAGVMSSTFHTTIGSTPVGQNDHFTSGNISLNTPFNYLAVHFGDNELFFKLLSPTTTFTISTSGEGAGLSNFRAYSAVSSVPVPAAVWLFGSALVGLMSVARRKQAVI